MPRKNKMSKDKNVNGRMVFSPTPPAEPDEIVRCIFGVSLSQFAQEILKNPGGKYDALYIDPATAQNA